MSQLKQPNIAFVYDRVTTQIGGAEQVLLALHAVFPNAPLYTSVYNKSAVYWADSITIIPSFLQSIPFASRFHRLLPPLLPIAFEQFSFDDYDIIISISSAEAKGIITKPHQLHIDYQLTPTRYLYSHKAEYLARIPFIVRPIAKLLMQYATTWDQIASYRPDYTIPISERVRDRIEQYYGVRKNTILPVIYPPVAPLLKTQKTQPAHKHKHKHKHKHTTKQTPKQKIPSHLPKRYLLSYGRLVSYKQFDLTIKIGQHMNIPVIIVGEGPDLQRLQRISKKAHTNHASTKVQHQTYFVDHLPKAALTDLILAAQAVLFPAQEDFGISQAESAFAGANVVLNASSGAAELINQLANVKTIPHDHHQNLSYWKSAIMTLASTHTNDTISKENSTKYDVKAFQNVWQTRINELWQSQQKNRYRTSRLKKKETI